MLLRALSLVGAVSVVALVGCSQLFPEFDPPSTTTATTDSAIANSDAGTSTVLTGKVCQLSDLRSPSSCNTLAAGRSVTVLETGAVTTSASDGSFVISMADTSGTVTLSVGSANGSAQISLPTISVLTGGVLTAAMKSGVLLPAVDAETFSNIELTNGASGDDSRGALVAWVLTSSGTAVSGAAAARIAGAIGPLYDVNDDDQLETGAQTGSFGTVSFLDLAPGTVAVTIGAPSSAAVSGDTFDLTVRAGSVTIAALTLPSS